MRIAGAVALLVVYVLHQDWWFWREARPLVFGVLPIGLFYHVAYTVAVSILLGALVRVFWPRHLDPPSPGARAHGR
jgi:putative flippase GtrA